MDKMIRIGNHKASGRRVPIAALGTLLAALLAACGGNESPPKLTEVPPVVIETPVPEATIRVLSSRPDMVSDDSALVEVVAPSGVAVADLKLLANGRDVTSLLKASGADRIRGLVTGLPAGSFTLAVNSAGGKARGTLQVINHPRTGPIFSGAQITPFECRTVESGLGQSIDTACSIASRYDWFYFNTSGARVALTDPLGPRPADLATTTTTEGATVPFIVRVETSTINRSIVRIAVLDDPKTDKVWNGAAWNQRIVFRVGESTAAQYNQGKNDFNEVFKDKERAVLAISMGYAYVISSLNVNKTNVNDPVSAETMSMVREHISKRYGLPRWMAGWGGSGGAIQQMLVAQNYPGVLDGIMPDAAFPDVFGTAQAVSDCRLLNRYFTANPATDAVRLAFEGHLKGTCNNWDKGNGDAVLATSGSITPACGLNDQSKVYHPVNNRTGARCTIYDLNANSLTRDPATGAARRPLDNVGVQYGLASLKAGTIGVTQFLDVNQGVGGYDVDGNIVAARNEADPLGLRNAYATGRVVQGGGGLATTPILHLRSYAEPAADIHTIYNDIAIREKLKRSNGRADNQVIWVLPHPQLATLLGLGSAQATALTTLTLQVVGQQLALMHQWLDGITGDPAPLSADKVVKYKPLDAVDSCWNVTNGQRIKEEATYSGAGQCNALYKKTPPPRMVAGAPITDDTLKCQLKPVDAALGDGTYGTAVFSDAEKTRLRTIFPAGVCEYTKPGVEQVPLKGTWLFF
jgi:hypothetical protein